MSVDTEFIAGEIAFKAKRYQEGIRFFTDAVKSNPRITPEQRESLAHCFHDAVKEPRDALRLLTKSIQDLERRGLPQVVEHLRIPQRSFEDTIASICNTLLEMVDVALLPVTTDPIAILFYTKLKGDYYRYLAELKPGDEGNSGRAKACYESALRSVSDEIRISDPVYLGLVLNYCVFQYEFMDMKDEAIERADTTFGDAVKALEELDEKEYGMATMLLQLLRDNITIWRDEKRDESG
jgi:14-3-3 protein epsilon